MSLLERTVPRDKPCCETFEKMLGLFGWFRVEYNEGTYYTMPYLEHSGVKWRVNNCPSCGAEVRDIELDSEKWCSKL